VNEIQEGYGTRASKTESLVYRVLQTSKYRTVEIIERFLDAAIIAGDKSNLRWRAQNILDRIATHGEDAIPRNEFDLVCWSDLQVTAGMQTKAKLIVCVRAKPWLTARVEASGFVRTRRSG